jgi:RNA recognition motif-containing protein
MSDRELRDLFAARVGVEKAEVVIDKGTGKSKGFGFVELTLPEDAQPAIEALNGFEIQGRELRVQIAKAKRNGNGGRLY